MRSHQGPRRKQATAGTSPLRLAASPLSTRTSRRQQSGQHGESIKLGSTIAFVAVTVSLQPFVVQPT